MKILLLLALLAPLGAVPARAEGEEDKASSGERFLEQGGQGGVRDGSGGVRAGSGGSRDAENLVNGESERKRIDGKDVPGPEGEEESKLDKAMNGGKYAAYGAVIGGVVLGVVGSVGGPAGTIGGAAAGVKLGAVAGAGIGFAVGWLLGGGKKPEVESQINSRQAQLDALMRQ